MADEPMWTLVQAAQHTRRSRATIQRLAADGSIVGAVKDGRAWRVPISGLIAAGLEVHDSPQPTSREQIEIEHQRQVADLRARADRERDRAEMLATQLARADAEIERAEMSLKRADEQIEHLRSVIDGQMRMLNAAPSEQIASEPMIVGNQTVEIKQPSRSGLRRLWRARS
jgi:septal ring factor EnvC (AmiA/AmiB activator)